MQWFLLEAAACACACACACAGKLSLSPAYLWRTFMNGHQSISMSRHAVVPSKIKY
jgi:hypothetical protein